MPTVKLPLSSDVYTNVDGVELNDKNQRLIDGYKDELGAIVSRPALSTFSSLSATIGANSQIDGLYWWEERSMGICVAGSYVFKLTYPSSTPTVTGLGTNVNLVTGTRVSFTTDGTYCYMANGARIVYTDGTTLTTMADADAPTTVSHVAFLDTYILANQTGTSKFFFSNVSAGTTWDALDFAQAVGAPDLLTALYVANREIFLVGTRTIEIWENDGITPFVRVPGGLIERGTKSPYSFLFDGNEIQYMDTARRITRYAGVNTDEIASPFDQQISRYPTASDCLADHAKFDGQHFSFWTFPQAQSTLVYSEKSESWSEWGTYRDATEDYDRFNLNCLAYAPDWNLHLVGGRNDSTIYYLNPQSYSDSAGNRIRTAVKTGHLDFGTSKDKQGVELRFRAKCGQSFSGNTAATLMLRWKKNGRNEWSNIKSISLREPGNTDILVRQFQLGIFRTIQFELSVSDAVKTVIIDPEMDIEVLR